jgi:hypothetical protein
MSTNYSVTVTMTSNTVSGLLGEGMQLVAFAAVQGTDNQALPLVWSVASSYGTTYTLSWTAAYGAYASSTPIAAGTLIQVATSSAISIGETLSVTAGPVGTVSSSGTPGFISISNTTSSQFTCGLEQTLGGVLVPFCVYPLYGNNTQALIPLPTVVMLFTTAPALVGEAYSPAITAPLALHSGLAADATGAAVAINLSSQSTATVAYDINAGWSSSGQQAQTIPSSQIIPTLIQPTPAPTALRLRRAKTSKESS